MRRFGPVHPIVQATLRRSFVALATETLRAAAFLGGCGLVAVGISGLVALVMNVAFGRSFVGGTTTFPGIGPGPSVTEVANDAVLLRVLATPSNSRSPRPSRTGTMSRVHPRL